ncbi:MAG: Trk system potassium transporter TrkA [Eubacterium sp.]|nr:Trk system potassium transporter TrkA [Eubacterium sp.]
MQVAIAGAGVFGYKIAEALENGDHSVTLIDIDSTKLDKAAKTLDVLTVNEDARKVQVLKDLGIDSYDCLIAVTETDEINLAISVCAKELGCPRTAARIREPEYMGQLDFVKKAFGIDMIVNPGLSMTQEIYRHLTEDRSLKNGVFSSGNIGITEFDARDNQAVIGLSLSGLRELMPNLRLIGLVRNGTFIIPKGKEVIEADDTLYLIGSRADTSQTASRINKKKASKKLKRVMIIGGGRTGFYLARNLSDAGIYVKIVEIDPERSKYLADNLDDVIVLKSNGTDLDLLEEEGIDDMDAFIATTSVDEENLLLALAAKRHGIPDVISRVDHDHYKNLIEDLGVDMVINPLDISTSEITEFIQGTDTVASSALMAGQARLTEILVGKDILIAGTPISNLGLSESSSVAAIERDGKLIFPDTAASIEAGDRLLVTTLISDIGEIERLLKRKQ